MLLKRLVEYTERADLPPVMYDSVPIKWYIDLDQQGNLEGFVPLTGDGRRADRGQLLPAPAINRSSGIRPKLLADNGEYVLGIARERSRPERVARAHEEFKELTRLCAKATGETSVKAVANFLENWDPDSPAKLPEDFNPEHNLTFRVAGDRPIDLASVREFWAEHTLDKENSPDMVCMICGEFGPVERRLPAKVKGIPGGQTSGTAFISANAKAFESYGLENSLIAPTCRDCGEKMAKGANDLIQGEDSRVYVGPLVYIFWTKEETAFSPGLWLTDPPQTDTRDILIELDNLKEAVHRNLDRITQEGEVGAALTTPFTGQARQASALDVDAFYASALSASGGRVVVRGWLETTIGNAIDNLQNWFTRQLLVDASTGQVGSPYSIFALAASLYRDSKDIPARVPQAFLQSALTGQQLPYWLMAQAVQRNRADQGLTRPRAVVLKMTLLERGGARMEGDLIGLDTQRPEAAYHCGRLLAQLEEIQRLAIRGIKQTLIDRYFGAASSSPASVFGVLVRNSQAHLGRLRKTDATRGAFIGLQRQMEDIMASIKDFPATLDLNEQALFALGYYHQRAANRAAARANIAKQRTGRETI